MSSECEVIFKIEVHTQFNETVRVVGDIPELGSWDPNKGFELTTNPQQYPVWYNKSKLMVKRGVQINYKIVIFNGSSFDRWEDLPYGVNRTYKVSYDKVLLEGREGVASQKEVVLVDAMSKQYLDEPNSLMSVDDATDSEDITKIRIVRKNRLSTNHFNPFKLAESDESSDDLNGSRDFSLDLSPVKTRFTKMDGSLNMFPEDPIDSMSRSKSRRKDKLLSTTPIKEDDEDQRLTSIYEQLLISKGSNRVFQGYNNFSHHEPVFSHIEESLKLFNIEKIAQLVIVSLTIPFNIKIMDDESNKMNALFGRYSRIKFEEDKRSIAWNLYNTLKTRLGSKLTWVGCIFDSFPSDIKEDIRDSLTHSYSIVPIFINDPSYGIIRRDAQKLTTYNEFKGDNLGDSWTRLDSFNQHISQALSHHCHPEAIIMFLHKEFMLVPQLLVRGMPKLDMCFYWDESFPSIMNRSRTLYQKDKIVQSLLNCRSLIFYSQGDLRNFADYCVAAYSCQMISKKGILILKYYGRQIAIDTKVLLLQPGLPVFTEGEKASGQLQCIDQFLSLVSVFTPGQYDHIEGFLIAIKGIRLLKGGKARLFVICEGFDPPNCQYIIDSTRSQMDPNFSIELLRIDDHGITLEFLKKCDILIDEQYAEVSVNSIAMEFMLLNTKRALCLINSNYNSDFRSGNVGKCDFASTKDIERGVNKLIEKLLLVTLPITATEIEKLVFESTWQSYEGVISAIQFISSLMINNQLVFTKDGNEKKTIAINEECKVIKPEQLSRASKAQNRVIFISIDKLLKKGKKLHFPTNSPEADLVIFQIFKQSEFNHLLLEKIEKLATKSNNVFVISSRSQNFLEKLFDNPEPLNLIAENGCVYKNANSMTWYPISRSKKSLLDDCWKVMENYTYKLENAFIKKTEHYLRLKLKAMDSKANAMLLKTLHEELSNEIEKVETFEVAIYDKSVHVRPYGLNKGSLVQIILQKVYAEHGKIDFVVAFGRSESDEEIFAGIRRSFKISQEIFTQVGIRPTYANYYTKKKEDVLSLLSKLQEFA